MSKTLKDILASSIFLILLVCSSCSTSSRRSSKSEGVVSPLALQPVSSFVPKYTFRPSGHDGGGGQSAIAADPFHPGVAIAGADISGFHRTENYGRDWLPYNFHNEDSPTLFNVKKNYKVAAVMFSKRTPDRVYAGIGDYDGSGGFLVSDNGGKSWTLKSEDPQFCGANTMDIDSKGHPRSVGRLIVIDPNIDNPDPNSEIIYVGTYKDGLKRSTDGGSTWQNIALPTGPGGKRKIPYIRGIAIDEDDAQTLYVGCLDQDDDGINESIYKITNAKTATTATLIENTPFLIAEELVVVGHALYVAANNDGIWKYDGSWEQVYIDDAPSKFYSIEGFWNIETGHAVIFAGTADKARKADPEGDPTGYLRYSIIRSDDSGKTWRNLTGSSEKIYQNMPMGDANGEIWWHSAHDKWYQAIIGGGTYVSCQLVLDPTDPTHNRLYSAGRAGTWRTDNALSDYPDWYPAMRHMNVTINRGVTVDPNFPNRVHVLDVDWVYMYSEDKLDHMWMVKPTGDSEYCIAVDSTSNPDNFSPVYLGAGTNLYYLENPTVKDAAWQIILSGKGKVLGVTVKKVGSEIVVLAACQGTGIWRKQGSADWVNIYNKDYIMQGLNSNIAKAVFSWGSGESGVIYFTDRDNGIFRSLDNGITWAKVYTIISSGSMRKYCGFVSIDPLDDNIVYASNTGGVWKSTNAKDAAPVFEDITSTIKGLGVPGPIKHDDEGNIYLASLATNTPEPTSPKLFFQQKGESTWGNIADIHYISQAALNWDMAIGPGPSHDIYVACDGTGLVIGTKQR